jgi:hypothetical protein
MQFGPMRPGALSIQYGDCQKPRRAMSIQSSQRSMGRSTSSATATRRQHDALCANYAGEIKKEMPTYKRFHELTQEWVT